MIDTCENQYLSYYLVVLYVFLGSTHTKRTRKKRKRYFAWKGFLSGLNFLIEKRLHAQFEATSALFRVFIRLIWANPAGLFTPCEREVERSKNNWKKLRSAFVRSERALRYYKMSMNKFETIFSEKCSQFIRRHVVQKASQSNTLV